MGNPGEAKASPQQTTNNEEETPFFTTYAHLVPTAKSLAPEAEEDELSSSDKKEFLLGFQEKMAAAMSAAMSEVISKLLEKPMRNHGEKQCRKNLRKKEAKHLTDDTGTGSTIV